MTSTNTSATASVTEDSIQRLFAENLLENEDDSLSFLDNPSPQTSLGNVSAMVAPPNVVAPSASGLTEPAAASDSLQNFFSSLWYKQTKSDRPPNEAPRLVAPPPTPPATSTTTTTTTANIVTASNKRRHVSDTPTVASMDHTPAKHPHLTRTITADRQHDSTTAASLIAQRNAMLSSLLNKRPSSAGSTSSSPCNPMSNNQSRPQNAVTSTTTDQTASGIATGMSNDPLLSDILQEASDMQNEWINRNNSTNNSNGM